MNFTSQVSSIEQLNQLAKKNTHSVLISGCTGSGKTYLAKQYASILNVDDFQIIQPKVNDIRECIEGCIQIENRVVICIENLDLGVISSSYTLLKFLEEPYQNTYIVVTCRSLQNIPDTIISRCNCIEVSPPTDFDLINYAKMINKGKYEQQFEHSLLFTCVKNFYDIDRLFGLNTNQIQYFDKLNELQQFRGPVSNTVWKLGHYDDDSETPIDLVIQYIMMLHPDKHAQLACISCIDDLRQKRIAAHAVLTKFVFEMKYCE